MNIYGQKKLTKKECESIALISVGTFLEYFDLYLYVHMTVLLNDIFFPQNNYATKQLLAAFAFCSTYFLRPIGGYVMGRIGDLVSRRFTILLTTFVMALSCIIIASTPTYAEIGITATFIVITARMLQGFSSLGEIMGAQIYITEMLKLPNRCIMSGVVVLTARIGTLLALTTSFFVLSSGISWRWAFIAGALIACIGIMSRTRLREAPDFIKYKEKILNMNTQGIIKNKKINKLRKKTALAYFFTEFHSPICFTMAIIYLGNFMKESFYLSTTQIISHNLKVTVVDIILSIIVIYLVRRWHPIRIAIFTSLIFIFTLPFIPYWLGHISSLYSLFCLQCVIISLCISTSGTIDAIQYKYFYIGNRFTTLGILFGFANPLGYAVASFLLIPLIYYLGYYAIWIVFIPTYASYWWAINYFKKLEIKSGHYHHYPYKDEDVEKDIYSYNYELGEEYISYKKECKYSNRLIDILESMNKTTTKEVNIRLVEKAILFAKKWHGKQKRKTGEPFYSHPLEVARMVAEYKFKTHVVVAAILHDVVEDSDCTVELISKEFTPRIAEIVELLTREYTGKKLSIAETIKRIFGAEDYEALLIKGLDRVHNLQTIHGIKSKKQKEIAEETIYEIANVAAYAVDDLNINDKGKLERKLYKLSNKALKKANLNNS